MTLHSNPHRMFALPLAFPLVVCLLMIGVALHTPDSLRAQEPETVIVQGIASNGTDGGPVPANMPITLHAIDQVAGRVATYTSTIDPNGAFTFREVKPLAGGSYVLVMDYEGMRYSELLESEELASPVEFKLYEITRDISVIVVERQAMIIADVDEANREIQALEVLSVRNASDRTLLPELTNITNPADINFLRFSLPTGATELSVQSSLPGGDIIPMGTGFAVTAPVPPGDHEITYTYRFPYQGDSVSFSQRLIQGAEQYQLLAPVALSQIQVSPLEAKPRIDVGGASYLVWEAEQVLPGRGVTLQITQLPQPGLTTRLTKQVSGVDLWLTLIPAALALALGALLLWAWFRAPRSRQAETFVDSQQLARRQALIQAVAVLDDRHERGQLAEEDYRTRREELMDQLRGMPSPAGD